MMNKNDTSTELARKLSCYGDNVFSIGVMRNISVKNPQFAGPQPWSR